MRRRALRGKRASGIIIEKRGRPMKRRVPPVKKRKLMQTKGLNLGKLKPGDVVLTSSHKNFVSWGVREALDSPYSHVAVYMGKVNGRHMIKDFRKGKGGKLRPLEKVRGKGKALQVLRWNATKKQMNAYMENVRRINGKYDVRQALGYGIKYRWKRLRGKKLGPKDVPSDVKSRYTCSEFIAEAANPPKEKIESGELVPVRPPIVANPKIHREMTTPKTFSEAQKQGTMGFVTEEQYETVSPAQEEGMKSRTIKP